MPEHRKPADDAPASIAKPHRARKRFGQNFLHDQAIVDRIVRAIRPRAGDHIVEIGPGQGALTFPLLEALDGAGPLTLLELDRDLAAQLEPRLQNHPNASLWQTDALAFDFAQLVADTPAARTRIVGNLPYNISTPLLFHLLAHNRPAGATAPLLCDMHFMLQHEVVQRLCASPGSKQYGRLSVMTQYACDTEQLFIVPPSAFSPQPKVQSAIIRLAPHVQLPHPADNAALFASVVKAAFAQRRKTLRNNLRELIDPGALQELGIDPGARAETLALGDFVSISNRIAAN